MQTVRQKVGTERARCGISSADDDSTHRMDRNLAQLDLQTMRYLFPNERYAATCRASGNGSRSKTPSLNAVDVCDEKFEQ